MSQQPVAIVPPSAWRQRARIWGLFIALTVVMTWPNALHIATHSVEHQDIFFNLWRLRWVQHALTTAPASLFDGNQFHPEPNVLAYSDAMLLQGAIATPLLSAGLAPLLVHNLLHLGAIAASGIGMFTLARYLSQSGAGAVLAGVVFAFAPYRFGHFMHMELQWAMWVPWAFWALQRTLDSGAARFGILTGVFVALQILSSIYYGIFLALLLTVVGGLQLVTLERRRLLPCLGALAAGAVLAISVGWLYSAPYRAATQRVGTRSAAEILEHSATLASYVSVTDDNLLYGSLPKGGAEGSLFPGLVPVLLAAGALVLVRPSRSVLIYLAGLIVAFDLSLGINGLIYPYLHAHVTIFKGLRAPARASVFLLMFLGTLAACGCAQLLGRMPPRLRSPVAAALTGLLLMEYWVGPLRLTRYFNTPPPLYAFLARQPPGIVAEFPMPKLDRLPGHEARYAYASTFHWHRLVNGYSGYYPPSYLERVERLGNLDNRRAVDSLRAEGVRYVVVHEGSYIRPMDSVAIIETLTRAGAVPTARLHDGFAAATMFELR